ncbi:70 kDa peptidyl-prolyl isomerase-like [Solanum dulcamara]|uniref:70 kDa peptidyl-prolyl isomerase-like n=1 Tax=Solanum dulcamara TaxID=45834 RepID=UPI0024865292|nr:70 kDa peptidyl-prolyl isomerase-like [Solanum dulcamara]
MPIAKKEAMDEDFEFPVSSNNAAAEEMDMGMDDFSEPDPIMKVDEEKEIGKTGIKKKLLKEDEGWEHPSKGDEVEGTDVTPRPPPRG